MVNQVLTPARQINRPQTSKANAMDTLEAVRIIAGLLFTVGLMLAAWLAVRRFAPGMLRSAPNTEKRLTITDTLALDARRRMVIVRDGDTEHVLLLGLTQETFIESRAVKPISKITVERTTP